MNREHTGVKLLNRSGELPQGLTREEVVSLMAREVAGICFPGLVDEVVAAALEREAAESTYLGRGLAVPHARVKDLSESVVYIASGLDVAWGEDSADCVALLCSPADCPDVHLQLLSKLVRWRMKGGDLVL